MSRILITSALPYINGIKHLGTLAGSMLPADVYARFQRARGRETLYICATDEHGTPTELAAAEAGLDPATFCAQQHDVQHDLGRKFGLSWDHFGRSSSPQNHRLTQRFAQQLWEAGFIEERVTQQVYSNADTERILAGGRGGGGQPFTLVLEIGGRRLGELLIDPISREVRALGGVEAAFGAG